MAQPTVSTGTAGTTPASTADPVTVLLAEYAALKTEQNARIGARDHLVYATLTAIAAVVIGALQADMPILLLALPTVCAVLGWTRLTNDHKISAVGRYIHDDLAPTLNRLTGTPVLRWDAGYRTDNRADHRTDPHRNTRKRLQLGADLIAFLAGPGASFITGAVLDGGCLA